MSSSTQLLFCPSGFLPSSTNFNLSAAKKTVLFYSFVTKGRPQGGNREKWVNVRPLSNLQESVKSAIKIYLQRATFAAVAGKNYGGSEVLRRYL